MSNHDRLGSRPAKGDAELERAWRDASDEQPPSHLDAAIIAAARKSVSEGGKQPTTAPARARSRNWLTRWQPLAAAATVAGLAFVLVQMLPREHSGRPSMQYEESAPAPASAEPQPQSSSARGATYYGQAPGAVGDAESREQVAVPEQAPSQGEAPVPPPPTPPATTAKATASDTAATADIAGALGETSADRRQELEPQLAGRAATAAAAAPSSPARERELGNSAPLDTAAWASRIVALHESGNVLAAEDALRAFRAAEPDADSHLPDSLREWARTVE
ncbi:MAG: hypothetical protein WCF43_04470 [Steroidobacteraceae bacterium]